jgi:hypothetical protein
VTTSGPTTHTYAGAVRFPLVAVTVVCPAETPVATPVLAPIVATAAFEIDQVTARGDSRRRVSWSDRR